MESGRKTLSSLDGAATGIREEIQETEEQIRSVSNVLVDLQKQQAARYMRLAEIRLDHIVSGELTKGLGTATKRVDELLRDREQTLSEHRREAENARDAHRALEDSRRALLEAVNQAAGKLDQAEAGVQQTLNEDEEYQVQLSEARAAEQTAKRSEAKTQESEENRLVKGKSYEADPLFMYLWGRGYGTSQYEAGALARFLDDWVARLCKYDQARPNYAMLLEIPKRLKEHSAGLRAVADAQFENLKHLEENAGEQAGLPPLIAELTQAEAALDQADKDIEESTARQAELQNQASAFAAGEDEQFREAAETLKRAFERENLSALFRYAAATATAEDDVLVDEITAANEQAGEFRLDLEEHKRIRERQRQRLTDLEDIRRRFKQARYDSKGSGFSNAAMIGMILGQFLQGLASRDDLWRTIERQQRNRRRESIPDFGSGGLRPRNKTWRTPFPGGGGLGGGLGGRRGGGGGFRTGGGF